MTNVHARITVIIILIVLKVHTYVHAYIHAYVHIGIYTVPQKTVQNCFCHTFVKFPPTLIVFGT